MRTSSRITRRPARRRRRTSPWDAILTVRRPGSWPCRRPAAVNTISCTTSLSAPRRRTR
jgi:hypothetical protein